MNLYYVHHVGQSVREKQMNKFSEGKTQIVRCDAINSPIGGDAIVQEMGGKIPFDWIVRQYNGMVTKSNKKRVYFTAD